MIKELTIHSIAGYCSEKALWKLLVDLITDALSNESERWRVLTPDYVIVDGEDFHVDSHISSEPLTEFIPPEGIENCGESGYIWSLGALVCYASSGHYIFGGRGGAYQRNKPQVELPTLRKEHSNLDVIIKRCLCYTSSQRITLNELLELAQKGLESNNQKNRVKQSKGSGTANVSSSYNTNESWPEKMD